jgi:GAF domain
MKSRGVRVLLLLVAVAALVAAGAAVWRIEQRIGAAQSAADAFDRDARQAVVNLGDWRAAQQAYVAEGQPPEVWMTRAAAIGDPIGPMLSALRVAAGTAEAQGALESAIESFASLMQNDARARDYVKSGQRLSASDVIFVGAAPALERVVIGIDTARGQERVAFAVALEELRRWEVAALGAGAGMLLLVVLLLVPIPRAGEPSAETGEADEAEEAAIIPKGGGLHLSHDLGDGVVRRAQPAAQVAAAVAPVPAAVAAAAALAQPAPDLDAIADLCSSMARVQDTRELQGLLERTVKTLGATGVIVWMPDGPQGTLRPVLAQGYASLALSRMGVIHPAADNATATAYRTKSVVVVPAEALASGAVVVPLISSEGCSGAMAVELREGIEATPSVRAVATILAAQLATMFTPGSVSSAPLGAAQAAGAATVQHQAAGRL